MSQPGEVLPVAIPTVATPVWPGPSRSDYLELRRRIREEGLLDRRPRYYAAKIAVTSCLLAAGWVGFVLLGDSWYQVGVAVYLAVVFGQIGFLGHEAGHRQVFRSRRANDAVGFVHANLVIGLSYGWWMGKHNRHHAFPNQPDKDPDITIPAIAFTRDQARGRRGLARFLARHQAYLFFPMVLLEAVSLHLISVAAVLRGPVRNRRLEGLLLGVHCAAYFGAVLLVLSPVRAIVFIAVHQGLLGLYLGCAFAPNHKGMPVMSEQDSADFLRRQVLTSRNVTGGAVVETLLGGLNYQIEHHLFPGMPRPSLRRCRVVVRAFCAQIGVLYCEKGLVSSYSDVLRNLHAAGQ
ncbi:MAG TPA: acyl-CoA desaturase [Streptosporangiaceae bacterium]|nr:acyl-CoA desaturase [Streptosporangiaceae bacterium]